MRIILIMLGFLSFSLGFVGIFLPILPTTPFILLAAYFFSKSSERFYQWLINIPSFGKMIENWNEYGCVSKKGKAASAIAMSAAIIYIGLFKEYSLYLKAFTTCCMLLVMAYVLSRPNPPKENT